MSTRMCTMPDHTAISAGALTTTPPPFALGWEGCKYTIYKHFFTPPSPYLIYRHVQSPQCTVGLLLSGLGGGACTRQLWEWWHAARLQSQLYLQALNQIASLLFPHFRNNKTRTAHNKHVSRLAVGTTKMSEMKMWIIQKETKAHKHVCDMSKIPEYHADLSPWSQSNADLEYNLWILLWSWVSPHSAPLSFGVKRIRWVFILCLI